METHEPKVAAPRPPDTDEVGAAEVAALLTRIMFVRRVRGGTVARAPATVHPGERAALMRNLLGGVVGNVLEWYDFAVFGFLAPVVGAKFFPADDAMDSLLGAFSVFAAAYLVRPVGGIIFSASSAAPRRSSPPGSSSATRPSPPPPSISSCSRP
jgi:hypothetical protein